MNERCVCGDLLGKHHYKNGRCLVEGCPCKGFMSARYQVGGYIGPETTIFGSRQPMGSDEGKVHVTERTQSPEVIYPNIGPRYSLDELWPHKKFVKPIRQLATPHLRNIVNLFKDGSKLQELRQEEGSQAHAQMLRRLELVHQTLADRDSNLRSKVYNIRVRCDGMVRKLERLHPAALDLHEVRSVYKYTVEVLEEVEHALGKVDE